MHRLWDPIVGPLLQRLEPRVVVEIGSAQGENTRNLLELCEETGAVLHAVDPSPGLDVDEWQRAYPTTLVFHRTTSLEALPAIVADVVLIDGDHNWYTVYHELKALLDSRAGDSYPVVLLHDVGWPHGRRDLYYEPSRIPEPYRQPYGRGGLRPGNSSLDPKGGFNDDLYHALTDGGARNGVLTAVEDFMADHGAGLESLLVPGVHNLGIIFPTDLRSSNERAAVFIDELRSSPALVESLEHLERLRMDAVIESVRRRMEVEVRDERIRELKSKTSEQVKARDERVRALKAKTDELARERRRLMIDGESLRIQLHNLQAQVRSLRAEIATLRRRAAAFERVSLQRDQALQNLARLRSRRSVRLAQAVASLARPLYAAARWIRHPSLRRSKPLSETPIAEATVGPPDTKPRIAEVSAAVNADVVVCVHNAPETVRECINSVVASTNLLRHRLIVVDDGSDSPTSDLLSGFASDYPILIIRNEEAKGYTRAANQGIAASDAPFVVLLNSDTVVAPGWIEKMLRCATARPNTAVVGPYSNAASWQTIPEPFEADGSWRVNTLPDGVSVADMDARVERWSPRLYPEVPLVNGFCYLIARTALERVGLFDEETFPKGYGEEDDFSIRCVEAGFRLYLADDCYVFHAKSQSFTEEGRDRMVASMKQALQGKHGADVVQAKVRQMQTAEDRIRSQTSIGMAIQAKGPSHGDHATPDTPLRVGWFQPHLHEAGGIRRAIEITNRLATWGWRPVLIGWEATPTTWLPILADIADIDDARAMDIDILIVSDPDMVWPFLELPARLKVNYHLAPYMLYREPDSALSTYYEPSAGRVVHIANSAWMAETVRDHAQLSVEAVFPGGVDKRIFHPSHPSQRADVVCSGSKREHKGTDTIVKACDGLELLKMEEAGADQRRLAQVISAGRVFASAAWHEGFNMSALEAMACGVPVVMTDDGGSREYAVHEETALVVEPRDHVAMREQIDRLLSEPGLRAHLIENGIRTAWRFDWDSVSADFSRFLLDQLNDTA